MTKLKTVAMIGAMLLGSSALALAQTSPTTTSPSTSTTTAPSNTTSPTMTQPSSGSHPPMTTPMTGATSGSTSSSSTTTAPGPQSAMKSEQDVTKRLRADGYSDITGVKQDKNGYTASAMKNGKRVKVEIDADANIQSMN